MRSLFAHENRHRHWHLFVLVLLFSLLFGFSFIKQFFVLKLLKKNPFLAVVKVLNCLLLTNKRGLSDFVTKFVESRPLNVLSVNLAVGALPSRRLGLSYLLLAFSG